MTPSQTSAGSAPSLRRAFSTIGCPACTLAQAFALAIRHHIDVVELRALGGEVDLPVYFARTYGSPAAHAAGPWTSWSWPPPLRIIGGESTGHDLIRRLDFP
jgi:hypothetical protein